MAPALTSVTTGKSCLSPSFCTPPMLAAELTVAGDAALSLSGQVRGLVSKPVAALKAELVDVDTWAHLAKYLVGDPNRGTLKRNSV